LGELPETIDDDYPNLSPWLILILNVVNYTPYVSKYLSPLTFFYNFDYSSYAKNFAITIYFVCYMIYCCMHFKLDLSIYMFAIIFWIEQMVKVVRKNQQQQIFWYEGSIKITISTKLCMCNLEFSTTVPVKCRAWKIGGPPKECWRWISVNLAMSLPLMLALIIILTTATNPRT
jgi:hypothetical protein